MKQKINIRLGLIALIAIITTTIGITLVYYNLFQRQICDDLKQTAALLAESEVFQDAYVSRKEKEKSLEYISSRSLRVTWIDANGTVLFDNDTDAASLSNHLNRPEIKKAFGSGEGESARRSDTMGKNTFYYALLLDNSTVLRVSIQARTITSVLVVALPVIIGIAVLVLLICVLIGHFLTRQLMKPIEEMAENLDDSNRKLIYRELKPFADKIRSQHENVLAAAKSRQDFAANISHELKTPITSISGYAELIENRMVDENDEIRIAGQIRHNANRLLALVTDIIQLSELDHKELSREFETVDLFSIAKESVSEYKAVATSKDVRLRCNGIPAGINADRMLIREMIDNLLQNAIRYNKENGTVDVHVTIEKGCPILSVQDTGIGIPSDQLDRVFERFYRVDKSRSRETGGTGLGLAIVKHIVELHHADITIKSVVGKGTLIVVRF